MNSYSKALAGLALVALTAACSSSEVSRIQAASKDQLASIAPQEVTVVHDRVVRGDELTGPIRGELQNALAQCATGTDPHNVEVTLIEYDPANAGQAFLIGDSASVSGRVKFIRPATQEIVAEYQVEGSLAGGGIIGAAVLSNPIGNLAKTFAETVCADIFDSPIE